MFMSEVSLLINDAHRKYIKVHNFVRSHFTTREVPAVALGIIEKGFTWEDLLQIRLIC